MNILRPQTTHKLVWEKVDSNFDRVLSENFAEDGLKVRDLFLEFRDAREKLIKVLGWAGYHGNC